MTAPAHSPPGGRVQMPKKFDSRTAVLRRQFGAYEPFPGVRVKGDLTLGENIADLGGALVALDAYHISLGDKSAPVIDGLTGDQRFFLSYAQSWREKLTDATISRSSQTNMPRYSTASMAWYGTWILGTEPSTSSAPPSFFLRQRTGCESGECATAISASRRTGGGRQQPSRHGSGRIRESCLAEGKPGSASLRKAIAPFPVPAHRTSPPSQSQPKRNQSSARNHTAIPS
jgi:hypothetical protein